MCIRDRQAATHFFFYKHAVYKHVRLKLAKKLSTLLSTPQAEILRKNLFSHNFPVLLPSRCCKNKCDIIEFDDLLFSWARSCTRLFPSVKFGRRIHSKKFEVSSRPARRFSRIFLKYLHPYGPFVWSVRPPDFT